MTGEAKFVYKPLQNEAKSMIEIKFMKLKLFSEKAKNTRESKFTYNPFQNEANSKLFDTSS